MQQNVHRFADFLIGGQQADAMVMDIDHQNFKYVRYTKPEGIDAETDLQYHVGDEVALEGDKKLSFAIESYQHKTQKLGVDPLIIWVGDKDAVRQQITNMYATLGLSDGSVSPFKLVVNVDKLLPPPSAGSASRSGSSSASGTSHTGASRASTSGGSTRYA